MQENYEKVPYKILKNVKKVPKIPENSKKFPKMQENSKKLPINS